MTKKHLAGLTTGLLLFGMATMANANLVTNGSFETGNFIADANNTMSLSVGSTQITGWSVVSGELAWINTLNPWSVGASDGTFFLDITGYHDYLPYGGIEQNIPTIIGQTYALSFDLGSSNLWGRPASILASAGSVAATFTSALTGGNSDWERFILPFTANSTLTTISFVGTKGVYYIGLDNVSVTTQTASVPEPSTMFLLGTGMAGLVGSRARRKKK